MIFFNICIILLTSLFTIYAEVYNNISAEECLNMGFNSLTLNCETCDNLFEIIGSSDSKTNLVIIDECKSCCSNILNEEELKYEKAVLEIDKRFLSSFPTVQKIVDIKAAKRLEKSKSKNKNKKDKKTATTIHTEDKLDITIRYR
jgi:hypothetical protein